MIDSHCHLAGVEFASDLPNVVDRARQAGVARCLVILGADDDAEFEQAERVTRAWPAVRYAIGVHPHQAHKFADNPEAAARLTASRMELVSDVGALGEIGLDYHYDFSPKDVQQAVFRAQLALARDRGLPVIIHTREAEDDTLRLIGEEARGRLRGVFHCFTGDRTAASRALATGFLISIPGIVTFAKAEELRRVAAEAPADRLLIETDSPYLAPIPFRGKRNEPAFVAKVFELLSELRGVAPAALSATLIANFDALFGAPAPNDAGAPGGTSGE
jgi:TatD DNase family protein